MYDIDTRLLRSFLAVSTAQSFSRAADRVACSQATMSQRIRQLEDILGTTLFHRDYHHVTLSPAGAELLPHVQRVLDEHDALLGKARRGRISGSVKLGVAEDYVLHMLPKLLQSARRQLPEVELSIETGLSKRLCQQVEARQLDLALVTLANPVSGAVAVSCPRLHWVGAPGYRPSGSIWPLALFPEGCAFRAAGTAALEAAGLSYRLALVSGSGQIIHAAVVAEMGVSIMAEGTVPSDLAILTETAGLPALPSTAIQIVERSSGLSEAGKAVRGLIF